MDNNSILELSKYRLNQARDCLIVAENNIKNGFFKDAQNRSYYCVFHSVRAVLALDLFDSKKHSGIISEFHKNYIKTGIFPKNFSSIIRDSFQDRNSSDYEDFYIVTEDDAVQHFNNAKNFHEAVIVYLNKINKNKQDRTTI